MQARANTYTWLNWSVCSSNFLSLMLILYYYIKRYPARAGWKLGAFTQTHTKCIYCIWSGHHKRASYLYMYVRCTYLLPIRVYSMAWWIFEKIFNCIPVLTRCHWGTGGRGLKYIYVVYAYGAVTRNDRIGTFVRFCSQFSHVALLRSIVWMLISCVTQLRMVMCKHKHLLLRYVCFSHQLCCRRPRLPLAHARIHYASQNKRKLHAKTK